MRKSRRTTLVLSAAALAAVAGCNLVNPKTPAAPATSTSSEVEILALAKEVAQCVRNNGLPGFPDPYFDNGELTLPEVDANVEQQGMAILEGPCRDVMQRLEAAQSEQPQEEEDRKEVPAAPNRPLPAEELDKLKPFTECMRQHGLPTWPDPDPFGTYRMGAAGLPPGLGKFDRPEDVTFRAAMEACEPVAANIPYLGIEQ